MQMREECKMKIKYKEKIGDKTIIRFVCDAQVDVEETKKKIAAMITPQMTEKEIENLYIENLVYAKVGNEAELVDDETAEQIQNKLDTMDEHQLLLDSGEYDVDYRGVEYWIKKSSKWGKEQINETGIALPSGSVLDGDLTQEQRAEIAAQQEADRIAGLTPEQKAEEKRSKLHVLAREAITKAEEAELLGETFDKQAWIQPKKAELEKLYA
jgi:hypothetical protein